MIREKVFGREMFVNLSLILFLSASAIADDVATPTTPTTEGSQVSQESLASPGSQVPEGTRPPKKKSRGRKPREKEAEGTKAPNRFDADTFIKSRYELNGQSLEVDTE